MEVPHVQEDLAQAEGLQIDALPLPDCEDIADDVDDKVRANTLAAIAARVQNVA